MNKTSNNLECFSSDNDSIYSQYLKLLKLQLVYLESLVTMNKSDPIRTGLNGIFASLPPFSSNNQDRNLTRSHLQNICELAYKLSIPVNALFWCDEKESRKIRKLLAPRITSSRYNMKIHDYTKYYYAGFKSPKNHPFGISIDNRNWSYSIVLDTSDHTSNILKIDANPLDHECRQRHLQFLELFKKDILSASKETKTPQRKPIRNRGGTTRSSSLAYAKLL